MAGKKNPPTFIICCSYLFFFCVCCYYYYDDDEITSKEIVFHVMDRYSSIFLLPFRIIGWIGRANRVRGGFFQTCKDAESVV
jgi:hypothetical protein